MKPVILSYGTGRDGTGRLNYSWTTLFTAHNKQDSTCVCFLSRIRIKLLCLEEKGRDAPTGLSRDDPSAPTGLSRDDPFIRKTERGEIKEKCFTI
jgi:hypothetical protein